MRINRSVVQSCVGVALLGTALGDASSTHDPDSHLVYPPVRANVQTVFDQNGNPVGFNFGGGGGMRLPNGTTVNFGGGGGVYYDGDAAAPHSQEGDFVEHSAAQRRVSGVDYEEMSKRIGEEMKRKYTNEYKDPTCTCDDSECKNCTAMKDNKQCKCDDNDCKNCTAMKDNKQCKCDCGGAGCDCADCAHRGHSSASPAVKTMHFRTASHSRHATVQRPPHSADNASALQRSVSAADLQFTKSASSLMSLVAADLRLSTSREDSAADQRCFPMHVLFMHNTACVETCMPANLFEMDSSRRMHRSPHMPMTTGECPKKFDPTTEIGTLQVVSSEGAAPVTMHFTAYRLQTDTDSKNDASDEDMFRESSECIKKSLSLIPRHHHCRHKHGCCSESGPTRGVAVALNGVESCLYVHIADAVKSSHKQHMGPSAMRSGDAPTGDDSVQVLHHVLQAGELDGDMKDALVGDCVEMVCSTDSFVGSSVCQVAKLTGLFKKDSCRSVVPDLDAVDAKGCPVYRSFEMNILHDHDVVMKIYYKPIQQADDDSGVMSMLGVDTDHHEEDADSPAEEKEGKDNEANGSPSSKGGSTGKLHKVMADGYYDYDFEKAMRAGGKHAKDAAYKAGDWADKYSKSAGDWADKYSKSAGDWAEKYSKSAGDWAEKYSKSAGDLAEKYSKSADHKADEYSKSGSGWADKYKDSAKDSASGWADKYKDSASGWADKFKHYWQKGDGKKEANDNDKEEKSSDFAGFAKEYFDFGGGSLSCQFVSCPPARPRCEWGMCKSELPEDSTSKVINEACYPEPAQAPDVTAEKMTAMGFELRGCPYGLQCVWEMRQDRSVDDEPTDKSSSGDAGESPSGVEWFSYCIPLERHTVSQ